MKGSVIIPLSRDEEDTMRLIAQGIADARHLRAGDVDQLSKLRLAEQNDGIMTLTEFGRVRLTQGPYGFSLYRRPRAHPATASTYSPN